VYGFESLAKVEMSLDNPWNGDDRGIYQFRFGWRLALIGSTVRGRRGQEISDFHGWPFKKSLSIV